MYSRTTMQGTIYIEWSSEQRMFLVVAHESMAVQFPAPIFASGQHFIQERYEDNQAIDQELRKLFDRFDNCLDNQDASSAMAEMQTLRTRVLTTILGTRSPLKWLPAFLLKWQDLLSSMDESNNMKLSSTDLVDYCRELMGLAGGWKLVGNIAQARSTLEKCFEVTRRHLKAPFAVSMPFENRECQALRSVAIAAKKLLLDCVAFQTSLAYNSEIFGRHGAPAHVQASLSKEFWKLLREAPLSVDLARFLAQSMMKHRQFALVTRFLEFSSFSGEDAELTLIRARALQYLGFYRQSIQIAEMLPSQVTKGDTTSTKDLQTHCDRLKKLIASREKADEYLLLDQYEMAAKAYEECLTLADPADQKQIAALLFGHANALLGLEQVPTALNDLRKSLQLDPANKIVSIRLQTACLQLETQRIKKELSRR